jgi:hypothetical protein
MSSSPDAAVRNHGKLEVPQNCVRLVYDLAAGELTMRQLGAKYGVTAASVHEFKKRHRAEIDHQRDNLNDRFAQLWIAEKTARLAAYQRTAELADSEIQKAVEGRLVIGADAADVEDMEDGAMVADVSGPVSRYDRMRARALRSAAEELGQLPTRTTVALEATTIRHIIEGVDLDKL